MNEEHLKLGFMQARKITRKHAKTFYFASKFLPPDKRNASYSVYSICRLSDESVDKQTQNTDALEEIKNKIDNAYFSTALKEPLLAAFKQTINAYQIPKIYFDELIKGMYMDLNKNSYENFGELYSYCYRVAGVVGLVMLKIFGYTDPDAEKYAVNLGVAMQLTNILRDIKEDYQRGRIYLPRDEISKYRISESHIAEEIINDNFISLMKFQISRARDYYKKSSKGIAMINDTKSRLVVCMMKNMYAGILKSIENNNYDVFSRRAHVNTLSKTGIAFKVILKAEFI